MSDLVCGFISSYFGVNRNTCREVLWGRPANGAVGCSDTLEPPGGYAGGRSDASVDANVDGGVDGGSDASVDGGSNWREGLIGWWRFDEGSGTIISDSSGNGHDGTLIGPNGLPVWSSGVHGGSIKFDGVDDYVSVPHHEDFNIGGRDFTIEMWGEMDGRAEFSHYGFIGHVPEDSTDWDGWYLLFRDLYPPANNTFWFDYNSAVDETEPVWGSLGDYDWGRWHHYAVTYDNDLNRLSLYYDGDLISVGQLQEQINDVSVPLTFGKLLKSNEQYPLHGEMDEVAIYHKTLNVDEVRRSCRRHEAVGLAGSCPDSKQPIILTPLPNQILPPTRTYWSWRGERDSDGGVLNPALSYSVQSRIDPAGAAGWRAFTASKTITSGYRVVDEFDPTLDANAAIEITVTATDRIGSYQSARTFSTDDSVVGWWRFDGDTTDSSGNGYVGSLFGSPQYEGGVLGSGLNFNGNGDYVEITNSGVLDSAFDLTSAVSVTAWVYPQVTRGGEDAVMSKGSSIGGGSTGYAMSLFATEDDPTTTETEDAFTSYFYINARYCFATNSLSGARAWHFISGGYDSSTGQLHCLTDGDQRSNSWPAGTAITRNSSYPFLIGSETNRHLYGTLDEVILYNRGLSKIDLCNSYLAFCMENSVGVECDTSCISDD